MEIARDAPALVLRGLDRTDEERLAVALAPAQTLGEAPREGDLRDPEEDEAHEQQRGEWHPDAPARRRDLGAALVRLEEERCSVRRSHRQVDLVQLAEALLEAILR